MKNPLTTIANLFSDSREDMITKKRELEVKLGVQDILEQILTTCKKEGGMAGMSPEKLAKTSFGELVILLQRNSIKLVALSTRPVNRSNPNPVTLRDIDGSDLDEPRYC